MDLSQKNIQNLTSLWQQAGRENAYKAGIDFDSVIIEGSEWPNKLWFHGEPNEQSVLAAKRIVTSSPVKISIPYWSNGITAAHALLMQQGFEPAFEQIGMVLKLEKQFEPEPTLETIKVTNEALACEWEELFRQSFGYTIHHELLLPVYENTDFLIIKHDGLAVGTAIAHYTADDIAGIHAMGIVPAMRRRGFAEKMMLNMLHEATAKGAQYATLQASAMGKGLYTKLGFEAQFTQTNYVLNSNSKTDSHDTND